MYCHNRISYISQPRTVSRFFYKSEQVAGFDVYVPIGDNMTEQVHVRTVFPQQVRDGGRVLVLGRCAGSLMGERTWRGVT